MQKFLGTALGKSVGAVARLRGRGQALPGLLIEKVFPGYIVRMLADLPGGVVFVTGTNGKTTTTKIVVELLQANGKLVLTNPTGSNLTRGINSMLAEQAKLSGHLPYDIAVLELDEAYAKQLASRLKPRWVLALNVTRDQLDRFGEVDTAATMIIETMRQATEGVVTNADDPRLYEAAQELPTPKVHYFGVNARLKPEFPSDDELVAVSTSAQLGPASAAVDVRLESFKNQIVTLAVNGKAYSTKLQLNGQHNYQNAAAALALAAQLLPSATPKQLLEQLADIKPAFGRGQLFSLKQGTLRLVLIKNPAGFRQSLASYTPFGGPIMIAINDNIADGRDMSWLWDVDFSPLQSEKITILSGKRAADMAVRLKYDNITGATVLPDLDSALETFCDQPGDKLLFTTYTAMLHLHRRLEKEAGKTL